MKKLVLFATIFAAVALTACSKKQEAAPAENTVETTTTTQDAAPADTTAAQTPAAQ